MRLDAWMKKYNVGDETLAAKTGVDRVSINRLRRGIHLPSWNTMIRIAKATKNKVRPNDFLEMAAKKS